jgi:dihydroorotase
LVRGDVDVVATDHAPHAPELKDLPFDEAPPGMLGLEYAASLTYEALGEDADPRRFFALLSRAPARVAQLRHADDRVRHSGHGGALEVGEDANLVVFDPTLVWTARNEDLHSRATNSPYDGRAMTGKVRATIAKGRVLVQDGVLV